MYQHRQRLFSILERPSRTNSNPFAPLPYASHLLYHLQSSEQRPLRAQATTVFQNSGGLIVARNLLVQYLQVTDVFLTNENGMTMISDSTFTQGRWAVRYIPYLWCFAWSIDTM